MGQNNKPGEREELTLCADSGSGEQPLLSIHLDL